MELLYRPLKPIDESLPDYIERLGYWNGFGSKGRFTKYLLELNQKTYGGEDKNKISCLVAGLELLLKRNVDLLQRNILNDFKIPNGNAKVCHVCWQNVEYFRFYWRFGDYRTCHLHNVNLVESPSFEYAVENAASIASDAEQVVTSAETDPILTKLVGMHADKDKALELISSEIKCLAYETEFVSWIGRFFVENMGLGLGVERAHALINSGCLLGISVHKKMEAIFQSLVPGFEEHEKLVRIIAVLKIGAGLSEENLHEYFRFPAPGYYSWMQMEILSIDELVYALMSLEKYFGFPEQYKIRQEMEIFEKLDSQIDGWLCYSMLNLKFRSPYQGYHRTNSHFQLSDHRVDKDIRRYQNTFGVSTLGVSTMRYNEFLRSVGAEIAEEITAA